MTDAADSSRQALRSPLWWIIAAIAGFGLAALAYYFSSDVRVFPELALLALALRLVTGTIGWVLLYRARPLRPPPRSRVLMCLAWGLFAATGCALLANDGLTAIWAKIGGIDFASRWSAALSAPLNEELLKVSGLALLAFAMSGLIRSPMDGFVYGAFVGLGFQLSENFIYGMLAIVNAGAIDGAGAVIYSFVARVASTGWGSHWALSAVAGTGLGYYLTRRESPRRLAVGVGMVLLAMAMHWFFDAPLFTAGGGSIVKSLINLSIALTVYVLLRRGIRARARNPTLDPSAGPAGTFDAHSLLSRRRRRRSLRRFPKGPERDEAARLQQTQLAALEEHVLDPASSGS